MKNKAYLAIEPVNDEAWVIKFEHSVDYDGVYTEYKRMYYDKENALKYASYLRRKILKDYGWKKAKWVKYKLESDDMHWTLRKEYENIDLYVEKHRIY